MRIILAEDEPAIRTLLSRGLRRYGADVAECDTVAAAIEAAREPFDAAVIDANLADGSGLDAAALLCNVNPAARIVLCSGYPIGLAESGLPPSVEVSFLQKPFRIDQMFEALGLPPLSKG